jgi:RNA polymerase sigma-70 factor (ECF subfamily)
MSDITSISLLERLQQGPNDTAWLRMVDLYTPLIRGWLRRYALADQDVDDVVQDVLAVVVRRLPEFHKKAQVGAFRKWLRTITVNCLRELWRAQRYRPSASGDAEFAKVLDQLEDPESALSKIWDREHDQFVTRHLLDKIRPRFEDKTWQAFQRVALEGAPVDVVARELDMTANAVFIAKSRVVHALRQEGQGLLD